VKKRGEFCRWDEMERKSEKQAIIGTKCMETGTECTEIGTVWDELYPSLFTWINTLRSVNTRFLRGFLRGVHVLWRKRLLPAVAIDARRTPKRKSVVPVQSLRLLWTADMLRYAGKIRMLGKAVVPYAGRELLRSRLLFHRPQSRVHGTLSPFPPKGGTTNDRSRVLRSLASR
jgi:hypothetical protein